MLFSSVASEFIENSLIIFNEKIYSRVSCKQKYGKTQDIFSTEINFPPSSKLSIYFLIPVSNLGHVDTILAI
jgi:hypothetical protein